jgi:hypothetical protein
VPGGKGLNIYFVWYILYYSPLKQAEKSIDNNFFELEYPDARGGTYSVVVFTSPPVPVVVSLMKEFFL